MRHPSIPTTSVLTQSERLLGRLDGGQHVLDKILHLADRLRVPLLVLSRYLLGLLTERWTHRVEVLVPEICTADSN